MREKIDTFCRGLTVLTQKHPYWTELTRFALYALPVTVLGILSYPFDTASRPWWHEVLKQWLEKRGWVVWTACGVPLFQFLTDIALRRGRELMKDHETGGAHAITILSAINEFVGQKSQRFGAYAKRVFSAETKPSRGEIFAAITHPEEQIIAIITQIYFAVRKLTNDDTLKVVLVELPLPKQNRTPSYACSLPSDKPPSLALLDEHWQKSFFRAVAEGDGPRVISDISKHVRKGGEKIFHPSSSENNDKGSIIGFPLKNRFLQKNTHVVSLRSDYPNRLGTRFKNSYQKYLEFFFTRIHLEYNLKLIKDAAACSTN